MEIVFNLRKLKAVQDALGLERFDEVLNRLGSVKDLSVIAGIGAGVEPDAILDSDMTFVELMDKTAAALNLSLFGSKTPPLPTPPGNATPAS